MTDSLGIVVNVLTSDQHNWFMRYKPKELLSPTEAFITYISPVHYNAIRYEFQSHQLPQAPTCWQQLGTGKFPVARLWCTAE